VALFFRSVIGFGFVSAWAAAALAAQDIGPYSVDEWNALNVLQGAVRTPVIDSATLATTTSALRLIRDRYPGARYVPTGPDETVFDLKLSPLLSASVARANGRPFEPRPMFAASTLASHDLD
jgi:hypothetical protein